MKSTKQQSKPTTTEIDIEFSTNPLVRKLAGFVALSKDDQQLLEKISSKLYHVDPRTDLIYEGEKPDDVLLIMDGMACRYKNRIGGGRQIVAYLLPGDLCDIHGELLNETDHTIATLSACKLVRLTSETIKDLFENYPEIARALRINTLVDEATLREWLLNIGGRVALERMAHLFCELFLRFQAVGGTKNNSYALPLLQTELADTMSISVVHVNRTLKEMRRRGLIEFRLGQLQINDISKLKVAAGFKGNYLHLSSNKKTI